MSGGTREAGWYPDPWGTDDERYFDGGAWTRSTRLPGGPETPPMVDAPPVLDAPGAPPAPGVPAVPDPTRVAAPASTPASAAGPPPGWYADPWGAGSLRYWDGGQWTGHVNTPATGARPRLRIEEERTAARWARVALLWAGPALAVSTIAGAFQWTWIADHWDEITKPGNSVDSSGNSGAAVFGQLAGVVLLVAGVLFLIWFYRSAALAASSGLRARRSPGLATASFIIPILNLWWPYQSTIDLLPEDHPARQVVRRWWALWIGCTIGGLAVVVSAFSGAVAVAVTAAATVVLAMLAAVAARAVVTNVVEAHDALLAGV